MHELLRIRTCWAEGIQQCSPLAAACTGSLGRSTCATHGKIKLLKYASTERRNFHNLFTGSSSSIPMAEAESAQTTSHLLHQCLNLQLWRSHGAGPRRVQLVPFCACFWGPVVVGNGTVAADCHGYAPRACKVRPDLRRLQHRHAPMTRTSTRFIISSPEDFFLADDSLILPWLLKLSRCCRWYWVLASASGWKSFAGT